MSEADRPGVYFLFKRQRLVYVGRSKNPQNRIDAHRKNGRSFDRAMYLECEPADVAWVERALIEALNPPQNKMGVVQPRAETDEPRSIIKQIIVQRPEPTPDPHIAISISHARRDAFDRGMKRQFEEDFRSGKIPSFQKNPHDDRVCAPRYVTRGDLDAWFARIIEERAAAGWRASA